MGKTHRKQKTNSFKHISDTTKKNAKEETRRKNKGVRRKIKNEFYGNIDRVNDHKRLGISNSEFYL